MSPDALFNDLLLAVATGSIDIVQHLVEIDKVELRIRDSRGHSALDVAAAHGRETIIEYLISHKMDPMQTIPRSGMTPLHIAAANGHVKVVNVLLRHGCDKSRKDVSGATPLDYANMSPQIPSNASTEIIDRQSVDEYVNSMRRECRQLLARSN